MVTRSAKSVPSSADFIRRSSENPRALYGMEAHAFSLISVGSNGDLSSLITPHCVSH